MKDVKTKETVKDIKVLDKSKAALAHTKNAFVRSKEQARSEKPQSPEYDTPVEYATGNIGNSAKATAVTARRELKKAPKKAAENFNKAKQNFQKIKKLSKTERRKAAVEAHKKARQAKQKADFAKAKAEKAKQAVNEARTNVQQAQNAVREVRQTGRQTVKTARQTEKAISQSVKTGRTVNQAGKTIKSAGKGTVKTAKKTVKTANRTAKTALKTAKQTAKTAKATAQATARTAKVAAHTARVTAKAAVAATKVAVKATMAAVKAIIAAVKGLVAAIAAGGWVAVIIIVIVCMIAMLVGSVFGIFFSNDSADGSSYDVNGTTTADVMNEVNAEFTAKIEEIKADNAHDDFVITSESGVEGVKWNEVLAVYAVKIGTNPDNPDEVVTLTQDKVAQLKEIAWDMTALEFSTDEITVDGVTRTVLTVTVIHKGYSETAAEYGFGDKQIEQLNELMSEENAGLWGEFLG